MLHAALRARATRERTWQSYASALTPSAPIDRTELMRRLLADGIATRRGVMAIHQEGAYAEQAARPAPHRRCGGATSMMLPLYPGLTDEEQDYVIDRLALHAGAMEMAA